MTRPFFLGGLLLLMVALGLAWWASSQGHVPGASEGADSTEGAPAEEAPDDAEPTEAPSRYAPIPKIDVHVHVPRSLAASAMRIFRRNGVALALNASGSEPGARLETLAQTGRELGLHPYCHLDWRAAAAGDFASYADDTLRRCREQGAVGLKIFKGLGLGYTNEDGTLLRVDDPRLDPAFEAAGRHGLPVLIHTGDPKAFFEPNTPDNERYAELSAHPSWSFHGEIVGRDGSPTGMRWPSWESLIEQFEARVARHPDTTFVGAHFGNAPEEPDRVDRMLDAYPNLVIETGARIPEIGRHDPRRMRAFFEKHAERILFGTDFQMSPGGGFVLGSVGESMDPPSRIPIFYEAHWRYFETDDRGFAHPTPIQGDWTIDGLGLPREVLEQIYHRNAERIFGLEPLTSADGP